MTEITKGNIFSVLDELIAYAEDKYKAIMRDPKTRQEIEFWMNPRTEDIYNQAVRDVVPFRGNLGWNPAYLGFNIVVNKKVKDHSILLIHKGQRTEDDVIESHYRMCGEPA